jgi:hypothetical protein
MGLLKSKRALSFSAIIVLILIAFLLLFVFKAKAQNFVLVVEEGVVNYRNSETGDYSKVDSEEAEFKSGTFIKTDENSFAQIYLPDNSIVSLDASTEIQVVLETKGITIDQLVGNTWHRVWELTEGESYDVKTPTTIASVRGTIFSVDFNEEENSSIVLVEENTVEVNECEDAKLMLEEGKIAQINKFNTQCDSSDSDTFEELKNTDWYKKNKMGDEIFKELRAKNIKNRKEFRKQFIQKLKENPEYIQKLKNRFPIDIYNQFGPFIQVISPELELPENIYRTAENEITIEGRTNIVNKITFNGEEIDNQRGRFSKVVNLIDGENKITIRVENRITNRTKEKIVIILKGTGQDVLSESTITSQQTNNTTTGGTTGTTVPKPSPTPQPTPTPEPTPTAAIYLSGSQASYGINLNWIPQNLKYSEGFLILGSTTPGVSQQNASFSIWVPGTSTNYSWGIQDSQIYYLVVCEAVSQVCLTYSNEVAVKAPDPVIIVPPPSRSLTDKLL